MQSKRRPASPQAPIYISAAKVVDRIAAAFDCLRQAAVELLNARIRNGQLAVFGRTFANPECVSPIEGEFRIALEGNGHVYIQDTIGPGGGAVGIFRRNVLQILFRQADIDALWPPPLLEQLPASPGKDGPAVGPLKAALRKLYPPLGLPPKRVGLKEVCKRVNDECSDLLLKQAKPDSVARALGGRRKG